MNYSPYMRKPAFTPKTSSGRESFSTSRKNVYFDDK